MPPQVLTAGAGERRRFWVYFGTGGVAQIREGVPDRGNIPGCPGAKAVAAGVHRDAAQPRAGRCFAAKAVQGAVSPPEHLLEDVFRQVVVPGVRVGQPQDLVAKGVDPRFDLAMSVGAEYVLRQGGWGRRHSDHRLQRITPDR